MKALLKTLSIVGVLATGITGAQAADTTWTFDGSNMTTTGWHYGNTLTKTVNGSTVTINSFSDSLWGAGGPVHLAKAARYSGGLGVTGIGDSQHTTDNYSGTDMLLFDFGSAVNLAGIDIGYVSSGYNSDVSVAAFDSLAGTDNSSWGTVLNNAIFKTSFADVENNPITTIATEARYWLIGAYNSVFGGDSESGFDKFKILALHTNDPVDVPAPATALLMLLGLGLVGLRRRQK
ncbi:PEP-CTERM sorting domain-containing protein [Salinimonas marina]|uniref:PEP-CTERM sorting domain-containing protein n=1 Tax=Salinimonas marina TaxID=2785918 RepID=A0A7S9DZ50_9ALTE|nr:exosortase-dependent surface protein XDP1 [Salinimonas marina]QPG06612.1 PEP-CTERM sorting domain-containing protein [Salinimonas marina]